MLYLPLRPYALGHELTLLAERNPLLGDTHSFNQLASELQRQAILRAVLVCARPWAEQNQTPRNIRTWQRLLGHPHLTVFGKTLIPNRREKPNYPLAIAEFRNYLAQAHDLLPSPAADADEIVAEANGYEPANKLRGRTYGGPFLARLLIFAADHPELFPESVDKAGNFCVYDVPYARAAAFYLVAAEVEGGVRIENHDEAEEKLNLEKIRAETLAEELAEEKRRKASNLATDPPDLNGGQNG